MQNVTALRLLMGKVAETVGSPTSVVSGNTSTRIELFFDGPDELE